ncbi:MAG: RNA-binding cell elongation regulator Jag/EloR [Armatimonadota bacterium]
MDGIEVSGRTLDEALQLASQRLGVSLDEIEYEVVEEGSKGFLGLGQTPAVVRAWIKETERKQPAMSEEALQEPVRELGEAGASGGEETGEPGEECWEPEEEAEPVEQAEPPSEEETDLLVETVLRATQEIIEPMNVKARAVLRSATPEEIVVDLAGPEVGILIGRRGQTLEALQYLVGVIVNRRVRCRRRIILDAENYRARHREMLERKAREYAKAVKEQGKEAVLEPQCARDRRIIHMALADDPDVYTYSEGEGENRHVVISPRNK